MPVSINYGTLREMIYKSPLALHSLTDKKLIAIAEAYLPYSTGIEVECCWNCDLTEQLQPLNIPYLMYYYHDSMEKRFRIPPGIKGMICLYHISEWLKTHCGLNDRSGIHYHIDMGIDFWDIHSFISCQDHDWILKSLDKWGYKGSFNERQVSSVKAGWVSKRVHTLEFRIGEMTFDYELLIKRILNCQNIVRRLKYTYGKKKPLIRPKPKHRSRMEHYSPW